LKKLVYESYVGQRFLAGPLSANVRTIEVLNILRHDRREISVICRVKFKNPISKTIFEDRKAEVHLLDRERKGSFLYFIRRRLPAPPKGVDPRSVYLSVPWSVENGVGRVTMLGNTRQIHKVLQDTRRAGVAYKIVSLSDAKFSAASLLGLLTGKQREAISTSFELGYYDIPRKAGSDEIAKKLGIRNPTFVAHRRKAELRLLTEIMKEN
jgi:predicted DNA binding protein